MAENDNKVYVQDGAVDKAQLSKLLNRLKGANRSMAQFASDCGEISASTLSRIVNGKISKPLPLDTLKMLYDHRDPDSQVDFDILARANGMVPKEDYERIQQRRSAGYRMSIERRKEEEIRTLICNELFDRGHSIRVMRRFVIPLGASRSTSSFGTTAASDFIIKMADRGFGFEWRFVVVTMHVETLQYRYVSDSEKPEAEPMTEEQIKSRAAFSMSRLINNYSRNFLIDAWDPSYLENVKYSYVFVDETYYNMFRLALKEAPLHNEVTTILIDENEQKVVKEEWLNCPQAADATSVFDEHVDEHDDIETDPEIDQNGQYMFFFGSDDNKEDDADGKKPE